MRTVGKVVAAALVLFSLAASAQTRERTCGAVHIFTGEYAERVKRVSATLMNEHPELNADVVTVRSDSINAWAVDLASERPLVCVATGIVRWTRDDDGQLAFIIAHELAHAADNGCRSLRERAKLAARSISVLSLLVGSSNGDEPGDQRRCETRADQMGVELLMDAGYDSEDAIRSFKKLQQIEPKPRDGFLRRLFGSGSGHPMSEARIRSLRKLMRENQ